MLLDERTASFLAAPEKTATTPKVFASLRTKVSLTSAHNHLLALRRKFIELEEVCRAKLSPTETPHSALPCLTGRVRGSVVVNRSTQIYSNFPNKEKV